MQFQKLFRRVSALLLLLLLIPFSASAGPMGFQGSWMSMGDLGPNWREVFVNYALTPRDAIGISQTTMRADDASRSCDLTELTYTRLLQRVNQRDACGFFIFRNGLRAHPAEADCWGAHDERVIGSDRIDADAAPDQPSLFHRSGRQ